MSYEVRLFTKSGARKNLPSRHVGTSSFTVDGAGGFADFTLSLFSEPNELTHIVATDRVEIWHSAALKYRGYISDLRRSEEEPATLELSGYGRVLDLAQQIITGYYQYPGRVDVSRCFSEIAAEVTARYPEVVVEVDEIGAFVESLDTNGKTIKEAFDALLEFARSTATYGFDVTDDGRDRLYLRKIGTEPSHTIAVPGVKTGDRESTHSIADLVNVVRVTGGEPKHPQMLPNPSMEVLRKAGDGTGGNLLSNGSFEDGGSDWTFSGGASRKTNGSDAPPAFSGNACAELDRPNEEISQNRLVSPTPLVPGRPYAFGFWIRGEYGVPAATPPTVRALLTWWDADGLEIRTDNFVAEGEDQAWKQEEQVFVCPSGAVGFKVTLRHVYGSSGDQRGAVVDDVYLQDATQMYVDGWRLIPFGSAEVLAETVRVGVGVGKHGRSAAYLKFTASNANDNDIHWVYGRNQASNADPQGYTVGVVGGRTYCYSVWQRYEAGWAKPPQILEIRWRKQDGSVQSTSRVNILPGSPVGAWQEMSANFLAPNDAISAEPWLTMRGNGEMLLDCMSLRDASDPHIEVFLDAGPLTVTFGVDEVFDSADPDLFGSITAFGRREKSVSVSGITTIADARAWAQSYLRVHALPNPAPTLTVLDYEKPLRCGDMARLVGDSGSAYADRLLPIARIGAEIGEDGILAQNLELLTPVATEEELYIARLKGEAAKIAGAGGAAGATTLPRDGGTSSVIVSGRIEITGGAGIEIGGDRQDVLVGISAGGVGSTQLASGAVTAIKIAGDAVTAAKIVDGAITGPKIAAASITSDKIVDGTIVGTDIANLAITLDKIAASGTRSTLTWLRGDNTWANLPADVSSLNGGAGAMTLAGANGISVARSGATITATLANTGVAPGSYNLANITVDAQGRVTSAASGTAGSSGGGTARIDSDHTLILDNSFPTTVYLPDGEGGVSSSFVGIPTGVPIAAGTLIHIRKRFIDGNTVTLTFPAGSQTTFSDGTATKTFSDAYGWITLRYSDFEYDDTGGVTPNCWQIVGQSQTTTTSSSPAHLVQRLVGNGSVSGQGGGQEIINIVTGTQTEISLAPLSDAMIFTVRNAKSSGSLTVTSSATMVGGGVILSTGQYARFAVVGESGGGYSIYRIG